MQLKNKTVITWRIFLIQKKIFSSIGKKKTSIFVYVFAFLFPPSY